MPEPPPARPARRDAAIEAALRRFDGEPTAAPASSAPRPASWSRHPQLGVALAASLVIVIGIPAAVIALRDQGPAPANVAPPLTARGEARSAPDFAAGTDGVPAAEVEQPQPRAERAVPAASPAAKEEREVAVNEPDSTTEQFAVPQPVIAAAPPPPSPPPPPPSPSAPMAAQKNAEAGTSNVVVTGSRIARPKVSAERDMADAVTEMGGPESEPYRFNGNPSYAQFMTRLQTAVRSGDRDAVIGLVRLPLRVNEKGQRRYYRNPRAVREHYERIFTPKVTHAILGQRTDFFLGSSGGVMIGNGEVWFEQSCPNSACSPPGPVRITAVNP